MKSLSIHIAYIYLIFGAISCNGSYDDIVSYFSELRTNTTFPAEGRSFDHIDETFGPRIQGSTGLYDWHRGLDIDGTNSVNILAVTDGQFYRWTNYTSGGWTVILRHPLTNSITYGPTTNAWNYFYTFYMHLDETNTLPIVSVFTNLETIANGQLIGKMGNSGTSPGAEYGNHVHVELRFGTMNSLEHQLENPGVTQAGFDPHLHPMLFFEPQTYTQSLSFASHTNNSGYLTIRYTADTDDMPILNRIEFAIVETNTATTSVTHVLDFNQRIGFDASSTAALDLQDRTLPYVASLHFSDSQTNYQTDLVIPYNWISSYTGMAYQLNVTVSDIWGQQTNLTFTIDTDGDGLTDAWEQAVGFDPLSSAGDDGGLGDPDGDGFNNFAELVGGTDPLDANSGLRLNSITSTNTGIQITWNGVGGRKYVFQTTDSLVSNAFSNVGTTSLIFGLGTVSTNTSITNLSNSSFFRMLVIP